MDRHAQNAQSTVDRRHEWQLGRSKDLDFGNPHLNGGCVVVVVVVVIFRTMSRKLVFRGTIALLLVLYLYFFFRIQRHSIKPNFEDFLADFTNDSKNASPLAAKNAQENERLVNLRKNNSVVLNRTGRFFLSIRDGNLNESVIHSHESLEQNNKQPPQTLGKFTIDLSQQLPEWMTEYFDWHKATKKNLNETNWNSTKYIVMCCTKAQRSCGGISDRLKPLAFVVLEAARYERLLLIWWEKPKPLEEFLVPPEGGVDWRVPDWLKTHIRKNSKFVLHNIPETESGLKNKPENPIVHLKIQSPSAGEEFYGEHPFAKSTYQDVFHGLFRAFFTPVSRLVSLIDSKMKEHNLVPGEYAATHLRAMYGNRKWRDPNETITLTVNGINCASTLFPGAPVYFAADIKFAVEVAREYGRQHSLPVGSLDFKDDPIHFDKDKDWSKRKASTYDDTFVDLYMLGQSRCVAYSNGGYGTFGSLLSYNASCNTRFFKRRNVTHQICPWTNPDGTSKMLPTPEVFIPVHLLEKPK